MESRKIWATLDPFHEGGEIMGRSVANEAFLRALLTLDPLDEYHFFLRDQVLARGMEEFLAREFPALAGDGRLRVRTRRELPGALASGRHHCFHLSDCINNPAHLARLRNALAPALFPITAPTHSLSYTRYMRDLLAHLWPGVTPRDCVVATSRGAVGVLGALYDHLDGCYGPLPRPRVERIPLGVDTEALCPPDPAQRAAARDRLGLDEDHCALLVFARISQYSKMDLVPVLRAARRMAAGGVDLARLRLFVAGWTDAGDPYPATLAALAANAGLRLEVVSRPDEAAKRDLFHAADVFLSPVDNPQETFGLTVLEAAAFGLPAVVSDYDGYRDLVQDGSTGLLVPTLGPGPTPDVDALAPLVFDNQSHLLLAQQTVVDVPALARALARLVRQPELRRAMGRAARERVLAEFTWASVVRRHVELWDALWAEPVDEAALRGRAHPLHMPYGAAFAGYPTAGWDDALALRWSRTGEAVYRGQDFITVCAGLEGLVDPEHVSRLVFFARNALGAGALAAKVAAGCGLDAGQARFLVLWALKHDLLERAGQSLGSGGAR